MEVREIVNSIGSEESPMASQRATNQIDHLQRRVSNLARGFSRDELPESAVKLIHAAETVLSSLLREIQDASLPNLGSKEDYCQDVTLPTTITLSSSSTTTVTWATTTTPSATATLSMANLQFTKFPAPVPWIDPSSLSSSEPTHPNQSNIVNNNPVSFPSNSGLCVHPSSPFSLWQNYPSRREVSCRDSPDWWFAPKLIITVSGNLNWINSFTPNAWQSAVAVVDIICQSSFEP